MAKISMTRKKAFAIAATMDANRQEWEGKLTLLQLKSELRQFGYELTIHMLRNICSDLEWDYRKGRSSNDKRATALATWNAVRLVAKTLGAVMDDLGVDNAGRKAMAALAGNKPEWRTYCQEKDEQEGVEQEDGEQKDDSNADVPY
jgi:hypothetical protein